jgi:hypothetical protein
VAMAERWRRGVAVPRHPGSFALLMSFNLELFPLVVRPKLYIIVKSDVDLH